MPRPLRLALVVLGLVLAVYGASTLTGRWLGTPPWWQRQPTAAVIEAEIREAYAQLKKGYDESNELYLRARGGILGTRGLGGAIPSLPHADPATQSHRHYAVVGREWISGAVIAVGVGLVACGARQRRRPTHVTLCGV